MKAKLLGSEDVRFEEAINDWLGENPGVEIRYVTAFPCGEGGRWFQVLIFFDEQTVPQNEWNPLERRSVNPVV